MIKLSLRLQQIANYVTEGARVADIGSDHALLPVFLLQSGKSPSAIAGELNKGPYQAARKQAADAGLSSRLDVRQGDGLAVLRAGEADTVTIAGMGGHLMRDILEAGNVEGKLADVQELILQPNVGEDAVRMWLLDRGWYLQDEAILEEDGKIYEVLRAIKHPDATNKNSALYDPSLLPIELDDFTKKSILLRMGPYLLHKNNPILVKKWRSELVKFERICKQLSESELEESANKLVQFRLEIKVIEEVLACLPMAKSLHN